MNFFSSSFSQLISTFSKQGALMETLTIFLAFFVPLTSVLIEAALTLATFAGGGGGGGMNFSTVEGELSI
jgi:hypothetical protein